MGAGGGELRVYLSLLPMSCPRAFGNRELVRPNRSAYAIDGKLELYWLTRLARRSVSLLLPNPHSSRPPYPLCSSWKPMLTYSSCLLD